MNKLAAAALAVALTAIPTTTLADSSPSSYPKYIPGTQDRVLWPAHDPACDKAMDDKKWDIVLGNMSLKENDPDAGECLKALKEYYAVLDTLAHLKGIPVAAILQVGANTAVTETEIAWALHAEGDDEEGAEYAKGAVAIYDTSVESEPIAKWPDDVTLTFGNMFQRLDVIYPDVVPPEYRVQPGDPGAGNPDPESSPGGPG